MEQEQRDKSDQRLHVILEDLVAVTLMIESGENCIQILEKVGTTQRGLRALEYSLIACQLRESITLIQNNPDPETQTIELSRLRVLYTEVIRAPYLKTR